MKNGIVVLPLQWWEKLADLIMTPVMYLLSGTFREAPQQTHRWNCRKLADREVLSLDHRFLLCTSYSKSATASRLLGHFHMPIFGGWRECMVLAPAEESEWYVGWIVPYGGPCGISRIKLRGPVRMLKGPNPTTFFALRVDDGEQLLLRKLGEGRIGSGGIFCRFPLL